MKVLKVINDIMIFLAAIFSTFLFVSCNKQETDIKLFYPNNNLFQFDALDIQHPERIKTVIQSDGLTEIKIEYLDGKVVRQSDSYLREPEGDYPPNFVLTYEYDKSDRLTKELCFINLEKNDNLLEDITYVYDENSILKYSNNKISNYYILKKKINGYELLAESHNDNLSICTNYTESKKSKVILRTVNNNLEDEIIVSRHKGLEYSCEFFDFKKEKKVATRYLEVTKYENNLIKEIYEYKFSKNGEKKLKRILFINSYDELNNWTSINIFDSNSKLIEVHTQKFVYLP